MNLDYEKLTLCLNDLLVDFNTFQENEPSEKDYFGLPVIVKSWDAGYYDGSQGKGLLTFTVGDEEFVAAIQYNSWGHYNGIEGDTDCNINVINTNSDTFAEQMIKWKEDQERHNEEDLMWMDSFTCRFGGFNENS